MNSSRWPAIATGIQAAGSIRARPQEGLCSRGAAHVMTRRSGLGKHQTVWTCSVQRIQFPPHPYPSACWMARRLTSRCLASSHWLTPFDRSTRMYSRCCSVKLGRRPGKRPLVRAFTWPATERFLNEFHHHSLKASTIAGWSLSVDVAVSKFPQGTGTPLPPSEGARSPAARKVSLVSGGAKVDRVGGRSLTAIIWC